MKRMRTFPILLVACIVGVASTGADEADAILQPGDDAAAVKLPLSDNTKPLADVATGKSLLLMFALDVEDRFGTVLTDEALNVLSDLETVPILVRRYSETSFPAALPAGAVQITDTKAALAKRFGITILDDREGIGLVWIDANRRIRWNGVWPKVTPDIIPAMFEKWDTGQRLYTGLCARCHGDDGTSTNYPAIKTLNGIGKRMTLHEILEETEAVGFVSLDTLEESEVEALMTYVAGL